jgi:nucleotide-binding universal stress UspA family protein
MISKILVPHDGTEMSDKAFEKAVELAKMFKAKLVLLHIIEYGIEPLPTSLEDKGLINRARRSARIQLEKGWDKMVEVKTHEIENDNVDLWVSLRADPALRKKQQNRYDSNGKSQIERYLKDKGSWQCDKKSVRAR